MATDTFSVDVAAGEHDHSHVGRGDAEHREHVAAREIGQSEVEHHDVGLQLRGGLDGSATVGRLGDDVEPTAHLQGSANEEPKLLDVVDQQDRQCHGPHVSDDALSWSIDRARPIVPSRRPERVCRYASLSR